MTDIVEQGRHMTDEGKYRIRCNRDWMHPWSLFIPGSTRAVGTFPTQQAAVRVMDAHARGADCTFFLKGLCRCRGECAR